MSKKNKIINDPIYGFVTFADDLLIRVINHRYFQRLHRIQQLATAHFVFPGATHTRLHHSLGAFYLMQTALNNLRNKGIKISEEERLACLIAILLHDSGHTPLSHTLEQVFLRDHKHEQISALVIDILGNELAISKTERDIFTLALAIFQNNYDRPFFYQLISSQIDVDRMDYLTRDSFYTGVAEGIIGYKRILQTLHVADKDQNLIIEEKGIYAVEKFLIARYFMHRQVYSHKNVWASGIMVRRVFERVVELLDKGEPVIGLSMGIEHLCKMEITSISDILCTLMTTDDYDIWCFLKTLYFSSKDPILQILCSGIFQRKVYKICSYQINVAKNRCDPGKIQQDLVHKVALKYKLDQELVQRYLIFSGPPKIAIYLHESSNTELSILFKNSQISPISDYYSLLKHLPEESPVFPHIYYAHPIV